MLCKFSELLVCRADAVAIAGPVVVTVAGVYSRLPGKAKPSVMFLLADKLVLLSYTWGLSTTFSPLIYKPLFSFHDCRLVLLHIQWMHVCSIQYFNYSHPSLLTRTHHS